MPEERTAVVLLQILNDENAFTRTAAAVKDAGANLDALKSKAADFHQQKMAQAADELKWAADQEANVKARLDEAKRLLDAADQQKQWEDQYFSEKKAHDDEQAASLRELLDLHKQVSDQLYAEAEAERKVTEEAQQALQAQRMAQVELIHQQQAGYGVKGGLPGPNTGSGDPNEEPDFGDGSGGGGGGAGGSMFGIAHGLTAGGRTLGVPGLTEAGGLLYMEQGIERLMPLLEGLGIGLIDLAAIAAPVAAAIVLIALVQKEYNDELARGETILKGALAAQQAYYTAIETGTKEQIQAQIAQAKDGAKVQQDIITENIGSIQRQVDADRYIPKFMKDAFDKLTPEEIINGDKIPDHIKNADQYKTLFKTIGDANTKLIEFNDTATRLQQGLDAGKTAVNDYAEATRKWAENNLRESALFADDDTKTTDALNKKKEKLGDENRAMEENIIALQKANEATGMSADQHLKNDQAIQKYTDSIHTNEDEILHIIDVSLGLAKAREDEAAAAKELGEMIKGVAAEVKNFLDSLGKDIQGLQAYSDKVTALAEQAAQENTNAIERERNAEQQYLEGSLQDSAARRNIRQKEDAAETQIELDSANREIDIRTKTGDKVAQLELDLQRQYADDQTKFFQSTQKLQRDEQRTEQKDALDHQQKLADIQRSTLNADVQALYDRNFLQVIKDKENKTKQETDENISYQRREAALRTHLAQQESDLAINLAQERQRQQVAEERKIADAFAAADREIKQEEVLEKRKLLAAQNREKQEIAALNQNEADKLAVMRQNLTMELILLGQQQVNRAKIAEQTEVHILGNAIKLFGAFDQAAAKLIAPLAALGGGRSSGGGGGGGSFQHALGGDMSGGEWGSVNEPGSSGKELWKSAGQSYALPRGAGLWMPLEGGTVDPNKGGSSGGGHTFYITSHDPQGVRREVLDILERTNAKAY